MQAEFSTAPSRTLPGDLSYILNHTLCRGGGCYTSRVRAVGGRARLGSNLDARVTDARRDRIARARARRHRTARGRRATVRARRWPPALLPAFRLSNSAEEQRAGVSSATIKDPGGSGARAPCGPTHLHGRFRTGAGDVLSVSRRSRHAGPRADASSGSNRSVHRHPRFGSPSGSVDYAAACSAGVASGSWWRPRRQRASSHAVPDCAIASSSGTKRRAIAQTALTFRPPLRLTIAS